LIHSKLYLSIDLKSEVIASLLERVTLLWPNQEGARLGHALDSPLSRTRSRVLERLIPFPDIGLQSLVTLPVTDFSRRSESKNCFS
jgi:hypothetical protein